MGSCGVFNEDNIKELQGKDLTIRQHEGESFIRTSVITTPVKLKKIEEKGCEDLKKVASQDETPIKSSAPQRRRSLMRDMKWEEEKPEQDSAKHSMEMRSRRCSKHKAYYDYQEYDDFAEDLSFLFEDEQLPDLEFRPRRKSRKKRSFPPVKRDSKPDPEEGCNHSRTSTSTLGDANNNNNVNSTSLTEGNFSKRPTLKQATPTDNHLPLCNNDLTSSDISAGTCHVKLSPSRPSGQMNNKKDSKGESAPRKRKMVSTKDNVDNKHRKCITNVTDNMDLPAKKLISGDLRTVSNFDLRCDKRELLKMMCIVEKLDENTKFSSFGPKNSLTSSRDYKGATVTRMMLRRRHSTPTLGGDVPVYQRDGEGVKITRTVSTPARALGREEPTNKGGKSRKSSKSHDWQDEADSCDDISDSEQFVDSPDSGFSSETSCSAVTPDGDSMGTLTFTPTKCNEVRPESDSDDAKHRVSRTSSNDSGINVILPPDETETPSVEEGDEEEGTRLILCQKSVLEAQRLELEVKKKQEEEMLREKYQCRWVECPNPFESRSGADLHSHLQDYHIDNYCCKWQGCKFFETQSRKLSFLQRHLGEHSGEKPYKCILDGCDASFSSLCSRKRHVEGHYSEVTLPKARVGGDQDGFPRYLLNSRRVKDKRKTLANRHDCMDNRTLGFIKSALIRNEIAMATSDDISNQADITFHAKILGERSGKDGKKSVLVKWKPENLLPNEWILESDLEEVKQMKKSELPLSAKAALRRLFFFGRRTCSRKPATRKMSVLKSLF